MEVDWCKCILQSRCRLNLINLNTEYFDNLIGVYVISSGDDANNVISIGQGNLRDELVEKKIAKKVLEYGPDLFLTWAVVPKLLLEGVEAFLCKELNPKIAHLINNVKPIQVNLP